MTNAPPLVLTLRELRLILERLVQAAGVPSGALASVRDCAVCSAALPGPGLAAIGRQIERLRDSRVGPLRQDDAGPVDCAGQHAWMVAEALLDLGIDGLRRTGAGHVRAVNVDQAAELRVVAGLAERHGLTATAEIDGGGALISVLAQPPQTPMLLDRILHDGLAADAPVWRALYEASLDALAPDSFESRRHAGTVRVEADGAIIGRGDEDETDMALLTPDPARLRPPTDQSHSQGEPRC
jgi:hypothetical protein